MKVHVFLIYKDVCEGILPNSMKIGILFCFLGFVAMGSSCCSLYVKRRLIAEGKKKEEEPLDPE